MLLLFLLLFNVFILAEDLFFDVLGLNQLIIESVEGVVDGIGFTNYNAIDNPRLHLLSFMIGNNHVDGFKLSLFSQNGSRLILDNTIGHRQNEYIDYGITLYPASPHNGYNTFYDTDNIKQATHTVDASVSLDDFYDFDGADATVTPFELTVESNSISSDDFVFDFVDTTHATNGLEFHVYFQFLENYYLNRGSYSDTILVFIQDL